jgi:hypothetical protein
MVLDSFYENVGAVVIFPQLHDQPESTVKLERPLVLPFPFESFEVQVFQCPEVSFVPRMIDRGHYLEERVHDLTGIPLRSEFLGVQALELPIGELEIHGDFLSAWTGDPSMRLNTANVNINLHP